jgi:hypothetical protein
MGFPTGENFTACEGRFSLSPQFALATLAPIWNRMNDGKAKCWQMQDFSRAFQSRGRD